MASSFKSPADTAKACVGIAELKDKAPMSNLILLSFLAGAYIAFGGLLAEVATGGMAAAGYPVGMVKLLFGAVFPVGLMLVVIAGSELFTGNCMYMVKLADKWQNKDWEDVAGREIFSVLTEYKEDFSRCLKCYGCREACPICYCEDCCLEANNGPDWLTKGEIPPSPMFHLERMLHMEHPR